MKTMMFLVLLAITWTAIGALAFIVPMTRFIFDFILWCFVILFSIIGIVILSMK